jgi:aminopeptidase N
MPCQRFTYYGPVLPPTHIDRDFALPGDVAHYSPDRPVDIRHVALDLTVDFDKKALRGTCATTMSVLFEEITQVVLQAAEMQIEHVTFISKRRPQQIPLTWNYDGNVVRIALDRPQHYGAEFTLSITYKTEPRIGMTFIAPSEGDPDRAIQAHTQGQPENAHYWFPCHDSPNDRATMSIAARVPSQYFAVSNGQLKKIEEHAETNERTFYYHESVPFPAYLSTLAVGEFAEQRDEFGKIPVLYYARPGLEKEARLMMGDTPAMLAYYSEHFGIPYPYEKYAQVVLEEFIGAMENTSATSHSWLIMPDERQFPDWDGKATVAHELVHQWFGDLLTCRDWSHAWLNESFATYFEETWKQSDPSAGEMDFRLGMRTNLRLYLDEDKTYRRPIVYNVYDADGQELFDRHLYEKGSCVLHMLRFIVGEAAFWRAIQYYARNNRGREVVTTDLERAFEEATGKSMGQFFDQWVYHGGHPEFEVSYEWDADRRFVRITVDQKQEANQLTRIFTTPVEIAFTAENRGRRETKVFTITVASAHETFIFPLDRRPELVRFDPNGWILKTVAFDRPVTMLRWQLVNDNDPMGRLEAAEDLSKHHDLDTVKALIDALQNDDFWAVRAESAHSLAKIGSDTAVDALVSALLSTQHPRARRAIANALGSFSLPEHGESAEKAAKALTTLLHGNESSYAVIAESAISLGKTRSSESFSLLKELAQQRSWHELISRGALAGMGELATAEATLFITNWITDLSHPLLTRMGAAIGLRAIANSGRLEEGSAAYIAAREAMIVALDDPWIMVRYFVPGGLAAIGDRAAIPALARAIDREIESRPRRAMRVALYRLQSNKEKDGHLLDIRRDLEELRVENRKLRDRVTTLESLPASVKTHTNGNGHTIDNGTAITPNGNTLASKSFAEN